MRVGIPKEIKNNENRVGMTPAGVAELIKHGHEVSVQHTAGEGSGFSDEDYIAVGARIQPSIDGVYREADMIVKVKEPIEHSLGNFTNEKFWELNKQASKAIFANVPATEAIAKATFLSIFPRPICA